MNETSVVEETGRYECNRCGARVAELPYDEHPEIPLYMLPMCKCGGAAEWKVDLI